MADGDETLQMRPAGGPYELRLAAAGPREDDRLEYEVCRDNACPDRREGTGHAHLRRVTRADGEVVFDG